MEKKPLTIGIPRSMLYYRYETLWRSFFEQLGMTVITTEPTVRADLDAGSALAIDETCLSEKIWFGHVSRLIGKCDYILVPRISNFGRRRFMCTRFEALPDITRAVFYHTGQKFVDYNIDEMQKLSAEHAFLEMAEQLQIPAKDAKRAWREAEKAEQKQWKQRVREEELLLKEPGMKVLVCAHSYVIEDAYIGRPVTDFLKRNQVTAIRADICDRDAALKKSAEISPTLRWEVSREILGSAVLRSDRVDGIILMSAFPCGPDSMANEMIQRKIHGVPMLQLVLDGQSGTAGLETRLESFVDIIRFKEGLL